MSVTLPDGRCVVGTLYMEDMFIPDGEPVAVSATAEAAAARATKRTLAVLLTGGLTAKGLSDRAIVAELMRQGYLKDGDPDDDDRLRSVKKWRAQYRRLFPGA